MPSVSAGENPNEPQDLVFATYRSAWPRREHGACLGWNQSSRRSANRGDHTHQALSAHVLPVRCGACVLATQGARRRYCMVALGSHGAARALQEVPAGDLERRPRGALQRGPQSQSQPFAVLRAIVFVHRARRQAAHPRRADGRSAPGAADGHRPVQVAADWLLDDELQLGWSAPVHDPQHLLGGDRSAALQGGQSAEGVRQP